MREGLTMHYPGDENVTEADVQKILDSVKGASKK